MFVWRAARLLEELGRHAPETLAAVAGTAAGRRGAWDLATRRSIDYAVMEKARDVAVVPLDAGWDDVGSWDAVASLLPERGSRGVIRIDSPGSVVFGSRRRVAIVAVPNVAVVETRDALLVVARGEAERVREVAARFAKGPR
jgi:mannose-1-phosphate guanylyltransferase